MLQKIFGIIATALSTLHNYFDSSTKLLFFMCIQLKFKINLSAKLFFPRITAYTYVFLVCLDITHRNVKQSVASIPIARDCVCSRARNISKSGRNSAIQV